jgi:hypothetical protein
MRTAQQPGGTKLGSSQGVKDIKERAPQVLGEDGGHGAVEGGARGRIRCLLGRAGDARELGGARRRVGASNVALAEHALVARAYAARRACVVAVVALARLLVLRRPRSMYHSLRLPRFAP